VVGAAVVVVVGAAVVVVVGAAVVVVVGAAVVVVVVVVVPEPITIVPLPFMVIGYKTESSVSNCTPYQLVPSPKIGCVNLLSANNTFEFDNVLVVVYTI
jgi:hypothetical protein